MSIDEYRVGPKRPPKHSQFKKGQSGNAKGRPRKAKSLVTLVEQCLNERVTVQENGQRRVISKRQALVKQLVNKAASGDVQSLKILLRLLEVIDKSRRAEEELMTAPVEKLSIEQLDRIIQMGLTPREREELRIREGLK